MFSAFRLVRIPQDSQLQAWNAADELLLERLNTSTAGKIVVVNDDFAALAVALHESDLDWWHDSAMAQEALQLNCSKNAVRLPQIIDQLATVATYQTVIIHIPKSIKLFQWQLEQLIAASSAETQFYVLGMVKHVGKGHIKVMEQLFAEVEPGRAEKKARVIRLQKPITSAQSVGNSQYQVPELSAEFTNLPGCYAENTIDPGARTFIGFFNLMPQVNKALDLGCGNGLLAVALLQRQPELELCLVDDSQQGLASAQLSLAANGWTEKLSYRHSNGLNQLAHDEQFELIICNPPFHQSTTLTENIAVKMIRDAGQHLTEGGQLWLVANRHLDYRTACKRHFQAVKLRSNNARFNIIQCIK
ncbi:MULTISPECIES: methyltransferase [Reinekea]|uniref:23S rRNA (Guanine-N-2-)-methyltransferase RlmG n=1 Tax=Reinekea forsetii TaxID=1336806 RepID=A0A2K8KSH4_9GAMM|nr:MULTISPECIES: methyltransferase [Reinekea]ATX76821.1 23S rRNA (guanine-N-2-)-methyltransferase RlmG [Reinekea forsetii]